MNLPNKITLLRVVLIPAFLVVYLAQPLGALNAWVALVLFVVAAVTDAIDGYLARKMGLVTNFGKLMDPLADKMLVCAAFIAFTATGSLPAWATIILISREFYISGLRQLALEQKIVLAASTSAKIKTASQIVLVIYLLLPYPFTFLFFESVALALIIITAIISIYSAAEYTWRNKHIFKDA
ncbi:MAG: CDP-diacylglycerol--glycerol-3-phosphate 3-phosphatidyltransferase [Defluviitaleaceae bacterium]|nr:CDP-diacylglycerol--glycerol-3-phosphate 3-phosphatidyltransferase [Defluviitaleaceae bacterium]MCL2263320.1 CDP-diacylglycerol--glycerol-3-phosphate 3-phosphatidyltransferase [Defluviitaleaceae bacterium]